MDVKKIQKYIELHREFLKVKLKLKCKKEYTILNFEGESKVLNKILSEYEEFCDDIDLEVKKIEKKIHEEIWR